MRFIANLIIRGKLRCETGLRIGGTIEGYEIGGMDNPVLRDPVTDYPYIPGSSIKGKMRSLMEWALGKITIGDGKKKDGEIHSCSDPNCVICRIFGTSAAEKEWKGGPTRLIVRDAYPTPETKNMMDRLELEKGLPKVEWKTENAINRITAVATPRPMERVPRGSEFTFEMVYSIYDMGDNGETDRNNVKQVFKALQLLEDSTLGGSGSRGSGKVKFLLAENAEIRKVEDYENEFSHDEENINYISLEEFQVDEFIKKLGE